jgi:aquaporin TIP
VRVLCPKRPVGYRPPAVTDAPEDRPGEPGEPHREPAAHVRPDERAPLPIAPAAVAEALGSFAVVLIGAGSVVVAGSAGSGLVGVALATGFTFGAALAATLPLSAGGVNPVLTAAFWVAGRLSTRRAAAYVAAQLAGAVVAGLVLRLAIPQATWRPAGLGAPLLALGVGAGRGVLTEAVLSFLLTAVAFAMIVDDRSRAPSRAGLVLGLLLAAGTMLAWPLTGAALNPARALGPEVAGGVWSDWWVYWIGPVAGGIVAAVAYWSVFLRERGPAPAE